MLDFEKEGDKEESDDSNNFEEDIFSETIDEKPTSTEFKSLDIEELKKLLSEAVANEDYEKASLIKIEIDKRTNT